MLLSREFKHLSQNPYCANGSFRMVPYLKDVVAGVKNPKNWPIPEYSDDAKSLLGIANEGARSCDPSSNISSIFIYHQLLEQVLTFLIDNAAFLQQVQAFPRPIFPVHIRKEMTMAGTIGALRQTVWFQNKWQAVEYAKDVNNIRNRLAHGLIEGYSPESIKKKTDKVARIMTSFMFISLEGYGDIREELISYLRDKKWPDLDIRVTNDHGLIVGRLGDLLNATSGNQDGHIAVGRT